MVLLVVGWGPPRRRPGPAPKAHRPDPQRFGRLHPRLLSSC